MIQRRALRLVVCDAERQLHRMRHHLHSAQPACRCVPQLHFLLATHTQRQDDCAILHAKAQVGRPGGGLGRGEVHVHRDGWRVEEDELTWCSTLYALIQLRRCMYRGQGDGVQRHPRTVHDATVNAHVLAQHGGRARHEQLQQGCAVLLVQATQILRRDARKSAPGLTSACARAATKQ